MAREPTVPNGMVVPLTVPWRLRVPAGAESVIVPLRFDPDCCQLRLNGPWYAPPCWPDHFPESPPPAAVLDPGAVVVVAAAADVVEAGFAVVDVLLLPQPTAASASAETTVVIEDDVVNT
jgi:hypothetical protein